MELLVGLDRPATIPELLAQGAGQSQSSLYRNLAILEQCGVVRRIASIDDVARYELDETFTGHHHHVVCHVCGRVDDVTLPPTLEQALSRASEAAQAQRDFEVTSHRVAFVGTCGECGEPSASHQPAGR